MNTILFLLCYAFLVVEVSSEFNKHFADFVEENYGKTFLDTLQRIDLGDSGSFGGKNNAEEEIKNDPVIFVHGVSDIAGGKMQALAATYKKHGYTSGELYATTYDSGPHNSPIAWTEYSLKCEHVKQIRTLILAVKYYTQKDVDVVAYSLGVPIARKAILGGMCVDTREDLGSPLTQYVDTFIGVAGPNHGISLQVAGVSIPGCVIGAIPILPICSKIIGLYSGFCPTESEFLTDINESNHYEGRYVYSLYTETDSWIGYQICDKVTARIPGEDGHKLYKKLSHDDIILRTCDMQIQMMKYHNEFDAKTRDGTSSRQKSSRQKVKSAKLSDSSSEASGESGSRPSSRSKSGQTKKREINEYDYLSEFDQSVFENVTPLKGSSKISSKRIAVIPSYQPATTTIQSTRSYESYLPRGTENVIDMMNARPYPIETTKTQGDNVGGYHTRINVSFD
ncbi:hypothetical protein GCK72_025621 [Caenorhabditis remanei]|uniref:Uncharacterized protein n=1 Tax=Caenorhabditis remanei TaxID=31234 RepID=A0A6A5G3E6_CAERE|nr:hypothetical protein GCK72_025621 [Caenorhabditis remanei]KAF1749154.1 hypothetical protein GCK72_025621 [Caenorhabditis remanei]